MSHDPKRFPDPEKFDPVGRYYQSHTGTAAEYAGKKDSAERDHFAYGHGRRICQGSECGYLEGAIYVSDWASILTIVLS
jgi:cytochrome P450